MATDGESNKTKEDKFLLNFDASDRSEHDQDRAVQPEHDHCTHHRSTTDQPHCGEFAAGRYR